MKNVVREYLLEKAKMDKDIVIDEYIENHPSFAKATYTKGKVVYVNGNDAYSKNGLIHKVILKDEDYLDGIFETKKDEIIFELISMQIGDKFDYLDQGKTESDEEEEV